MTAALIYLLCAATSLAAALLLLRHYTARRTQLLLWSCIGFFGLALNNVMLFVDLSVLSRTDLSLPRALVGALAVLVLVYGLIWEVEG